MDIILDIHRIISIHALREEGDTPCKPFMRIASAFLSTPSVRRATLRHRLRKLCITISIHALREEGDPFRLDD